MSSDCAAMHGKEPRRVASHRFRIFSKVPPVRDNGMQSEVWMARRFTTRIEAIRTNRFARMDSKDKKNYFHNV